MNALVVIGTAAVSVLVGLLVLFRAAQRRIGWLLVAHGLCFGVVLTNDGTSTSRAGMVGDQLAAGAWVFLFLWLVLIAYLVPDGHTLSAGWRRWMLIGLGGVAAFLVGAAGDADGFRDAHNGTDPPLAWLPAPVSGVLGVIGLVLTLLLLFGAVFAVRARLRRSSGQTRLQLLWLVWGATQPASRTGAPLGGALRAPLTTRWRSIWPSSWPVVALPVTIGIAILRYQLFDIELVLSRTLTYGVLVAAVVAVYALSLVVAERLVGDSALGGVIAVALVAVAMQPAYSTVRRRIERWVYGYRSEPATALRRLGASLESADPLHVVEAITSSVRDALKVDRVWVAAPGSEQGGDPRAVRVPLIHRDELIGDLVVEVPAGRRLSPADNALLHDLARHAAVTVRAAQLAGELQASRSRIVNAREEERKRLRRELHDGVGPSLAAILHEARGCPVAQGRPARDALLTEIRDETKAAITEVRRAVDELRPPAIDEMGLSGAIRQRAASLSTDQLVFEVHGPPSTAPDPRGRRGRGVPHRLGSHDQRRQALRRQPLPGSARVRPDARAHRLRQRSRQPGDPRATGSAGVP